MAKSATDDEPLLKATCQRIPTDTTQEIKMECEQPVATWSYRCCLDPERHDSSWNVASWACVGGVPWTSWTTPCGEGKNGLRYVRSPRFRTRTSFGWLATFFFHVTVSRQLGLPSLLDFVKVLLAPWALPTFRRPLQTCCWPLVLLGACWETIKSSAWKLDSSPWTSWKRLPADM